MKIQSYRLTILDKATPVCDGGLSFCTVIVNGKTQRCLQVLGGKELERSVDAHPHLLRWFQQLSRQNNTMQDVVCLKMRATDVHLPKGIADENATLSAEQQQAVQNMIFRISARLGKRMQLKFDPDMASRVQQYVHSQ